MTEIPGVDGLSFILFTIQTGGVYRAIRGTREEYDEVVRTGVLRNPEKESEKVPVKYAAFGTLEANHDFVLGQSRG